MTDAINLEPPGERIGPEELAVAKARDLVRLLQYGRVPYVRLVECRRAAAGDVVVLDVEPEVPQQPAVDVRRTERLAVTFFADDEEVPETLSLRSDFPRVPHLNLRPSELPRSLCLYDETYADLRLRWTPADHLRRIHHWLTKTARGELHDPRQQLEPFLIGPAFPLVLPSELFAGDDSAPEELTISMVESTSGHYTLIARSGQPFPGHGGLRFIGTALAAEPQVHGVIWRQPRTLRELHDVLAPAGCDLLGTLRQRLLNWCHLGRPIGKARLIVVLWLPKQRTAGAPVEATDIWAFAAVDEIAEVGEDLGIWQIQDGHLAPLIGGDAARTGDRIKLHTLRAVRALSPKRAARLSGLEPTQSPSVAIGAGALGSQVVMHLVRSGFGDWTVIDRDHLLPHNTARHALTGCAVGLDKASAVAQLANDLFQCEHVVQSIVGDVLESAKNSEMRRVLGDAEIIADMSASVTVARHLANDVESAGRRISVFLNPDGTDLVMLVEDRERRIRLDDLEMQYYREVIRRPELAGHLRLHGERLRYGHECRNVTSSIPQELVALHSGLAARGLRSATAHGEAGITLWRFNDEVGVTAVRFEPALPTTWKVAGWELRADQGVLGALTELRRAKLPNETGGILLGHHDQQRQILYVVDALPAPPDSKERPHFFDRGCQGLRDDVKRVEEEAAGMLGYVGEWHSHPDRSKCEPSEDDGKVLGWLSNHMATDGLPALMAIVCDSGIAWCVSDAP